jgi:hypothetical protein
MHYTVSYNKEECFFEVEITGEITLFEIQAMISEVVGSITQLQCYNILAIIYATELKMTILDLINLEGFIRKTFQAAGAPLYKLKRALYLNQSTVLVKFFETFSIHKGQTIQVFHDREAAKTWLTSS